MLKIKSVTDVITNSSSEVFLIKTNQSKKDLLKDLLEYNDDSCSGMGGIVEIISDSDYYIPRGFQIAEIDHSKRDLIDFLINYYNVVDIEDRYVERDNSGRITGYSDIRDSDHLSGELLDILYDYGYYKDLSEDEIADKYRLMSKAEKKKEVNLSAYIYNTLEKKKSIIEEFKKKFENE